MREISRYNLAIRLLSVFLLLFSTSCSLSTQTRDNLNAGNSSYGTFNQAAKTYCVPGLGDLFDSTTLQLSALEPQTYCLFDNFGVDRSVVLSVLKKYGGQTTIDDASGEDITKSLRVEELIDKIIILQQQAGTNESRVNLPIRVASLYGDFSPGIEVAQAAVGVPVLLMSLAALQLAIPAYSQYLKNNPQLLDPPSGAKDYAQKIELRAAVIAAAAQKVEDELCNDLSCNSVSVQNPVVEAGTCPPNTPCQPVDCEGLYNKMQGLIDAAKLRYADLERDDQELAKYAYSQKNPELKGTWLGHIDIYNGTRVGLQNSKDIALTAGCPIPPETDEWIEKDPPQPKF